MNMRTIAVRLFSGLLPLCLTVFIIWPATAQSATVAMITDLQGKASIVRDGRSNIITILAEIEERAQVLTEAGTTLVALYIDSGDEYVVKGPALLSFNAGRPEALKGAQPTKRGAALNTENKNIRVKTMGIGHGALVLRGARIRLLNLNDTISLESQPEFRWQVLQPGLKYKIEIADETGYSMYETQLDTTSFKLPASVRLKEGASYTWQVSTRLPDDRKFSNTGIFSIATTALRAQVAALRPDATAPFSSRIIYATWLEQMTLKDEARKFWQAAALERPEDPRLKALADQ